ncbi:hypothetical protein [Streptomyces similanensis]|uniref:Calmodulin n=1 Tax=Streptomyces similanensis TaxID=1274988 RepID=A0ABP9KMW9_9ACTN
MDMDNPVLDRHEKLFDALDTNKDGALDWFADLQPQLDRIAKAYSFNPDDVGKFGDLKSAYLDFWAECMFNAVSLSMLKADQKSLPKHEFTLMLRKLVVENDATLHNLKRTMFRFMNTEKDQELSEPEVLRFAQLWNKDIEPQDVKQLFRGTGTITDEQFGIFFFRFLNDFLPDAVVGGVLFGVRYRP